MSPTSLQLGATLLFAAAILHTFLVKQFQNIAKRYPEGSIGENIFHLLGEVEVVFGLWSGILFLFMTLEGGLSSAIEYLETRNFTEPAFVFVILTICSTKPVLDLASVSMKGLSKLIPLPASLSFYWVLLAVGPLLGSLITEPAIMTVLALLLLRNFYSRGLSKKLQYSTIGLLFVNVSIGGTLTPFAAPPVLMVAGKWGWDLSHMLTFFGWKAAIATAVSTTLVAWQNRKELSKLDLSEVGQSSSGSPWFLSLLHVIFLGVVVLSAHHMVIFAAVFLFFLGLHTVTQEYQEPLKLREGLLVSFFLGGLVVLGGLQNWWLEPVLSSLSEFTLYLGATALTAVTDNAALTYLGSQVPTLSDASKYALVAGSVVGGGLTVIANAPNPAGYGILNASFGAEGISPLKLFQAASIPTLIAGLSFWLL